VREHKSKQARDILGPIYKWFTEGLDSIFLREAKMLFNSITDSLKQP
jgi:hypothetical protein